MRPVYEQVVSPSEESFACLRYRKHAFESPYHSHPETEILHIEEGDGLCLIGNALEVFQSGDCFLFGPNLPHMFVNSGDSPNPVRSRYIQFSPACLGNAFFDLPELGEVSRLLNQGPSGLRFAVSAAPLIHSEMDAVFEANGARKIAAFLTLLAILTDSPRRILTMSPQNPPVLSLDSERMGRVLKHIHANFRQNVRLSEVANVANLSISAFERFFRRHVRLTFSDYLTEVRLAESRRLLLFSDKTVAEIAFESGFNNLSNFNRHFKRRHEISPTQFRAKALSTRKEVSQTVHDSG